MYGVSSYDKLTTQYINNFDMIEIPYIIFDKIK